MRRRLREKYGTDKLGKSEAEKSGLIEYLATRYNLLRIIFTYFGYVEKKYCICCGKPGFQDDYDTFKHCQTGGCTGVYCEDCFRDLNNVCEMCTHPIEYDTSEADEELDSSEEEDILRKREEARMRALLMPTRKSTETDVGEIDSQASHVDATDLFHYTQNLAVRNEAARQGKPVKDRVSVEIFGTKPEDADDEGGSDSGESVTV